jgi:hypothetical protein
LFLIFSHPVAVRRDFHDAADAAAKADPSFRLYGTYDLVPCYEPYAERESVLNN